jgi:hypothetical protein
VFYILVAKLKMNTFSFVGIACIAEKGKYSLGSHDLTKSASFCYNRVPIIFNNLFGRDIDFF